MADNRTMAQMLQAPIEGYEDAIVVPPINANNFELKQPLINLVQSNKFTGRQDPHNHLRFFNKVTSTFRHPEVPNTSVKLLLFPFSLDGKARDWLDKEPLIEHLSPKLGKRFMELLRKVSSPCPTEDYKIIENKAKVRCSRNAVMRVSTNAPPSSNSSSNFEFQQMAAALEDKMTLTFRNEMNEMKNMMKALVPTPAPIKAVEERCTTCGENDKVQIQKFWEMFKKIHVDITLADALILMPKYQKMLKSLLSNKEKLNEMANTPVSEKCSAIILKKLPEKLEDPGQFLIPCNFSELKCKALADLGASINLMPFSVYTKLGLPALQSTRMTLELANCSLCVPKGIARDVLVPVGRFTFPADFVVVDFECNYRVPLILGRPFLRTARVLIDVHGEEIVIRDGMERIVFKPDGSQDKSSIHMMDILMTEGNDFLEEEEHRRDVLKHDESLNMDLNDEFNDEDGDIIFLEKLLENENFFEMNDKKVEFLERKTKEDFETKDEPKKKKELQGKIFDPGITFHEKSFEKDTFKDKSSKELAPSKALLTLDVFDPLHPPLMDFHVTKALSGFSGFWKTHGSNLWKDKAMPTISIDGLQSSLHKVGNLLSLSLSN
ncbi:reverse transcriptase domain-containing protein [Tanacetum coccineum]